MVLREMSAPAPGTEWRRRFLRACSPGKAAPSQPFRTAPRRTRTGPCAHRVPGTPKMLLEARLVDEGFEPTRFSVNSDGERFFYNSNPGASTPTAITVVVNCNCAT